MDKLFYVDNGDERMDYCRDYLALNNYSVAHYSSDADYVILSFRSEYKNNYKDKEKVFCYGSDMAKRFPNAECYCTQGYLEENSYLTAQGTLTLLLNNIKNGINEISVIVLGYGNCGKSICNILLPLCRNVTCYARNKGLCDKITVNGIKYTDSLEKISEFDVIINTIPHNILNCAHLEKLSEDNLYIEIASLPYGFDIAEKENYCFNYIHGSALPGKFVPKSAGESIAKSVLSLLKEDGYE